MKSRIFLTAFVIALITAFFDISLRAYASECEGYDEDPIYSECDPVYCGESECDEEQEAEEEEESDE